MSSCRGPFLRACSSCDPKASQCLDELTKQIDAPQNFRETSLGQAFGVIFPAGRIYVHIVKFPRRIIDRINRLGYVSRIRQSPCVK